MTEYEYAAADNLGGPLERQPPQRVNRVLYLLILTSFFLPFATVRSCAGDEGSSYTGFGLVQEEGGVLLVGVLLLAVLLFAFSFRRRVLNTLRQGLVSASKALACALAILTTTVITGLTFMFSQVSTQIGFYVCVGSWLVLFLLSMQMAISCVSIARSGCREPPPPWGLTVCIVVVAFDLLTVWLSDPNGVEEVVLGIIASLLVGAPIVLIAMLMAVRYRIARLGVAVSGPSAD